MRGKTVAGCPVQRTTKTKAGLQLCPDRLISRWFAQMMLSNDAQGLTGISIGRLLIKGRFEAERLATDSP